LVVMDMVCFLSRVLRPLSTLSGELQSALFSSSADLVAISSKRTFQAFHSRASQLRRKGNHKDKWKDACATACAAQVEFLARICGREVVPHT
jgi:hypothetical protein